MQKFLCVTIVFGTLFVRGYCDSYGPPVRKICRLTGQDINSYVNGNIKPHYSLSPANPIPPRTSYVPVQTVFVAPPSTAGSASADTSSYTVSAPAYKSPSSSPSYAQKTHAPSFDAVPEYFGASDVEDSLSYAVSPPHYTSAPAAPQYASAPAAPHYASVPAVPAYSHAEQAPISADAPKYTAGHIVETPSYSTPATYYNAPPAATPYGQTYTTSYNAAPAHAASSVALNQLSVSSFVIPGDNSYKTYSLPPTYSSETLPIQQDGTIATLYLPNEGPAAPAYPVAPAYPSAPTYSAPSPCAAAPSYQTQPSY